MHNLVILVNELNLSLVIYLWTIVINSGFYRVFRGLIVFGRVGTSDFFLLSSVSNGRPYYRPPEGGRLYDMKVVSGYAFLRTYYVSKKITANHAAAISHKH